MSRKKNNGIQFKPIKVQPISWQKSPSIIQTKPFTWQKQSINIKPFSWVHEKHDTDWDGVPNFLDCNPWNPNEQGFVHEKLKELKEKRKEKKEEKQVTQEFEKHKGITSIGELKSKPVDTELQPIGQGKFIHRKTETEPRYKPQDKLYVFYKVRGMWRNAGSFPENTIQDVTDNIRVQLFNQQEEVESFHVTDQLSDLKVLQKQAIKGQKAYKDFQTKLERTSQWEHAKEEAKEYYKGKVLGPDIISKNIKTGLGLMEKKPKRKIMYYSLAPRRPSQHLARARRAMIDSQPILPRSEIDSSVPRKSVSGLPPASSGWFGSLAGTEPYRPVPYRPTGGKPEPVEEDYSQHTESEEETGEETSI